MRNWLKNLPLFPVIFGILPVIMLYSNNVREMAFEPAIRSLTVSVVVVVIFLILAYAVMRDALKAALITTLIVLLFFSYGHLYSYLKWDLGLGAALVRHRYLVGFYALVFLLGIVGILRSDNDKLPQILGMNLLAMGLLIYPIILIAEYYRNASQILNNPTGGFQTERTNLQIGPETHPDIYYIISDTYMRMDALQSDMNFDNSDFIDALMSRGFYVAECSRANYASTIDSLTSSLNIDYLPEIQSSLVEQNYSGENYYFLIRSSFVRNFLESRGYKTVGFDTGFQWSTLRDADYYLSPSSRSVQSRSIQPFELLLLDTSAGRLLLDYWNIQIIRDNVLLSQFLDEIEFPYRQFTAREQYMLATLSQVASLPEPKFVFAHIMIPHTPRVFDSGGEILTDPGFWGNDGDAINDEYDREGYLAGIQFVNSQLINIVDQILEESSSPPIIVIQGDTGKSGSNKHEILNAYYTRGEVNERLYSTITPVNSFRVILNEYGDGAFKLLNDESFGEERSQYCLEAAGE